MGFQGFLRMSSLSLFMWTSGLFLSAQTDANLDNVRSPLGINLNYLTYWSHEWTLIDVMKTSGGWFTQTWSDWDTGEQAHLDLDPHGWPRSLPADNDNSVRYRWVGALFQANQGGTYPGGRYVVLYDGEGTLEFQGDAIKNQALSSPGRDIIDVTPSDGGFIMRITATDPNGNGNYMRNIRVIVPGGICNGDPFAFHATASTCDGTFTPFEDIYESQRFHPVFLQDLRKFRVLRFMIFMQMNNNDVKTWADRTELEDVRWSSWEMGPPPELTIELANMLGADPWVNMPHQADDDYIRQFAALARANLRDDLKIYVEYSNEVWNGAFLQGNWVQAQGEALFSNSNADGFSKRLNWHGKRTSEVAAIWKDEWGTQRDRVVAVAGGFHEAVTVSEIILDCPLWAEMNGGTPCHENIDALAIAPYIGGYLGVEGHQSRVETWLNEADGGLNTLFREFTEGGPLYDPTHFPEWARAPEHGALASAYEHMSTLSAVCQQRNIDMIGYESGQHLVGVGPVFSHLGIRDLFHRANRDPRMGDLYGPYFREWFARGGKVICHFSYVEPQGQFGSFGSKFHQTQQDSPKFNALIDFIDNNPCDWEDCERPVLDLAIQQQPAPQSLCPGQNATFSVVAIGTDRQYQWYRNGSPISGATSETLVLTNPGQGDLGSYHCRVYNDFQEVLSETAQLNIAQTVSIDIQPVGEVLCSGDATTLSVSAGGSAPTYQWYRNGAAIQGATAADLNLTNTSVASSGTYHCVVANDCGSVTSNQVAVTVFNAVAISGQPTSIERCSGGSYIFQVNATGSSLGYQWRKNGQPIPSATGATYVLGNLAVADSGTFDCVVSNGCSAATSATHTLSVMDGTLSIETATGGGAFCVGDGTTLQVGASGADLRYQWLKNDVALSGATANQLVLDGLDSLDQANYTCQVSNDCGSVTSNAIAVQVSQLGIRHTSRHTVQGLAPLRLTAESNCGGTLEWYRDNLLVGNGSSLQLGEVLTETTVFRIRATHNGDEESVNFVVLVHPETRDPNGDGSNSMADLHFAAAQWGQVDPTLDADGDRTVSVTDLMYIHTGE